MDEELLELQRQFEFAQQAKSSIRLSDRNVVELVQKLQELHIIDFDLLHTLSGKEYITPEQLRDEMVIEVTKLGRVSLIDLADTTGVDLYHVEKQAQHVVSITPGLMLVQGEIISQSYWDTVAEEINDRLQECSQIALAELAAQLQISSELVTAVLEPRLGTMVKGRLEGGKLYTPLYVAREFVEARRSPALNNAPSCFLSCKGRREAEIKASANVSGDIPSSSSSGLSQYERIIKTLTTLFPVWVVLDTVIGIYKPAAVTWLQTDLFTVGLGFLMLSMGLTLTFEDFRRCLRNPWTVGVGFLAQYLIKPVLGFFIAMDGRISYEEFAAMMKASTDWRKASRQYSWERFNSLSLKLMRDGSFQFNQ